MVDYTKLSTIVFLINVFLYIVFRAYHWLVKSDNKRDETLYQQVVTIKIIGDAFFFVSLSVFVFFGSISVGGKILDFFAKSLQVDKAISMEESFLINFVALFSYVGIIFMNDIHKDIFTQIGKMRTDIK